MSAAPVSWLMIRPGWKVYASDGSEVGEVDEVAGDPADDIFDGLAVAQSALGKPRYVPAEQVRTITDGAVHLALGRDEVDRLGEYLEPATNVEIEADSTSGLGGKVAAEAREIEGKLVEPPQRHAHSMNIWRRMWLLVRRRTS